MGHGFIHPFSLVQKLHIGEVQQLHVRASSTCFWVSAFGCWKYMLDVHKFYFCHANSCQTILKLLCLKSWLNRVLSCQSSYAMPIKHGLMVHGNTACWSIPCVNKKPSSGSAFPSRHVHQQQGNGLYTVLGNTYWAPLKTPKCLFYNLKFTQRKKNQTPLVHKGLFLVMGVL